MRIALAIVLVVLTLLPFTAPFPILDAAGPLESGPVHARQLEGSTGSSDGAAVARADAFVGGAGRTRFIALVEAWMILPPVLPVARFLEDALVPASPHRGLRAPLSLRI